MKRCLCLVIFCIGCSIAFAQLEERETKQWMTIGALKTLGQTKAELQYIVTSADTTYMLLMKDFGREQPHYFSVTFKGIDETLAKFYTILKSFFTGEHRSEKNYMKTFTLGTTPVNLQRQGLITGKGIRLTTTDGYINLSEKDIDKLFGKR